MGEKYFVLMSTVQKRESMNNQIKKYIAYNYDLLLFFHHF